MDIRTHMSKHNTVGYSTENLVEKAIDDCLDPSNTQETINLGKNFEYIFSEYKSTGQLPLPVSFPEFSEALSDITFLSMKYGTLIPGFFHPLFIVEIEGKFYGVYTSQHNANERALQAENKKGDVTRIHQRSITAVDFFTELIESEIEGLIELGKTFSHIHEDLKSTGFLNSDIELPYFTGSVKKVIIYSVQFGSMMESLIPELYTVTRQDNTLLTLVSEKKVALQYAENNCLPSIVQQTLPIDRYYGETELPQVIKTFL